MDVDVDDENDTIRCGSYTFSENGRTSSTSSTRRDRDDGSSVATSSHCGFNYENTYEAISETPSTSSYGAGSENSSSFYETPSEGTSRCDEVDSHPDLDADHLKHLSSMHSRRSFLHPDDDKSSHISVYSESEYSDVMKKESSEASSETSSSGLGSESSPRVKARPIKKPPIPPKPIS